MVGLTNLRATELVSLFIREKMKLYDQVFVLVRNTLRIMMLNFKLKMPVWRNIFHPILIQEIGVIMSITGIFKIWMKQKKQNLQGRTIQELIKRMPQF